MSASLPNRNSMVREPAQKVCPACRSEFTCAVAAGPCWCEGVTLSSKTSAELGAKYSGCLCPKCLSEAQMK